MTHSTNGQRVEGTTGSASKTVRTSVVIEEELSEIIARREAAGLDLPEGEAERREHVRDSLVGLALSGGGIRSASFNLGVLQALHRSGLLRYIDYLSTVSGGGYIGSHLSSLMCQPDAACDEANFPLKASETGEQSDRVLHLTRGGNYLHRPLKFADHYLIGLLLSNLALFSGAFLVCALIAWIWRGFDLPVVRSALQEITPHLANDLLPPFLPSLLLASIWLVWWSFSYLLRGPRASTTVSPYLFAAAVVCAGIGISIVLGNGDVGLGDFAEFFGQNSWVVAEAVRLMFLFIVVVALLPFLAPGRLIGSGVRPKGPGEKYIFRLASTGLFFGIPLIVIYFVARENISGAADNRSQVVSADIEDWQRFLKRVADPDSQGSFTPLYRSLRKRISADAELADYVKDNSAKAQALRLALEHPETRRSSTTRQLKDQIVRVLNEDVLTDETLASPIPRNEIELLAAKKLNPADAEQLADLLMRRELRVPPVDREEIRVQNLLLISAAVPELSVDRNKVLRVIVIEADQRLRFWIILGAAATFALFGLIINLNTTSLHGFYRAQLAKAYIEPLTQSQPDIPLSALKNTERGAPYHLLTGAQNLYGTNYDASMPFCSFLFSKRFVGSRITGFARTEEYLDGEVDLATAMAVSGAAVSPMRSTNRLVALIMTMLNIRLGHWFPSPAFAEKRARPTVFRLMANWFRPPKDQRLCFVTDGGHNENLGLGQLLRRECTLILASDSGCDPKHEFADFVKLYWRSRLRGIRFFALDGVTVADVEPLKLSTDKNLCTAHTLPFLVRYPSGRTGLLIYMKPSFDGDEELDLQAYRAAHPDFPHDPTTDQFYAEETFEAYRRLGEHIGDRLLSEHGPADELWSESFETQDLIAVLMRSGSDQPMVLASKG
jgi:hypothetical protein